MSSLLILGAGGHGTVVADAAAGTGRWTQIAYLDDRRPVDVNATWPVLGKFADVARLRSDFSSLAVAVGDNTRRLELLERLLAEGCELPPIVHPKAWVSERAVIGAGTVVLAGAVINPAAVIGRACIINTAATVDHDCRLDDGVHVSPGAHLAGTVQVGRCAWIGIGACVRDGVRIGRRAVLGAGAAAVADLPDEITAFGVPARPQE